MRLKDAAKFFDKTVCTDAYDPNTSFLGQLDLYDDSKRDGVTVERRILSVSPDVVIPARRTIIIEDIVWIIGQRNIDTFQGSTVRTKYIIHQAQGLALVRTPKQVLTTGGLSVYSTAVWLKDAKEVDTSTRLFSFMNTYFAIGEPLSTGSILSIGTNNYKLRNVYESAAGIQIAEASTMLKPMVISVQYTALSAQAYNPATDSFGTPVPIACSVIWERFQDSYDYESASAEKYVPGDFLAIIEQATLTPKVGDRLVLSGVKWLVVAYKDDLNSCWELQVRRG